MTLKKIALLSAVAALVIGIATVAVGQGKITRGNWAESVGFKPDLSGMPKAGEVISAGNLDQYKSVIPGGVQMLIKKYGFKIWTKDYESVPPADSYIAATNKHMGTAKTLDPNAHYRKIGLEGYKAGLPFPQPKTGVEVAWNYTYSYSGDDAKNWFGVYWISAKTGIERSEDWTWNYITRGCFRTDIEPMPDIPEAREKGIQYYSVTTALSPLDKKGFSAMYTRKIEPKDQQGYIYVPAQRKSTRFAFGTRGDSWNNTDMLYEDVRGYMGYPEWMTWKIVEKKTMLLPMNAGVPHGKANISKVYDFDRAPHWNFKAKWEPRPVYVVEAKAKFPDYPYSKMVFYFDAELSYICVKDAYDKKGQLWKVLVNAWNKADDPRSTPSPVGTSLVVDLQAQHATAFGWHKSLSNVGLKPGDFSLANLRKLGK
jgi:Protein of unknown function (DUF1329)